MISSFGPDRAPSARSRAPATSRGNLTNASILLFAADWQTLALLSLAKGSARTATSLPPSFLIVHSLQAEPAFGLLPISHDLSISDQKANPEP